MELDDQDYFLLGLVANEGEGGYLPLTPDQAERLETLASVAWQRLIARYQTKDGLRYRLTTAGKDFVAGLGD